MDAGEKNLGKALGSPALVIGGVPLSGRALLAPMAGVTDLGMRRLARRFGASLVVTEMVAAEHFARGDRANWMKSVGAGVDLNAVQIAGRDPATMADAARLAADCGAAMVDINMGCPAKKVTSGHAGSDLMRDPELAVAIIRACVRAVKIPVTLKMRLGWDEASLNAPELGRMAESEGISLLTVHGRTRCQFFTGRADWAAIGRVKQAVSIPVVANGDCTSLDDAAVMLSVSGADAVMIGRSAVGRPWFVGDIAYFLEHGEARPEPTPKTRWDAAVEHLETLLDLFGTERGLRHARKHLAGYADKSCSRDRRNLRRRLVTAQSQDAVRSILTVLFQAETWDKAA